MIHNTEHGALGTRIGHGIFIGFALGLVEYQIA